MLWLKWLQPLKTHWYIIGILWADKSIANTWAHHLGRKRKKNTNTPSVCSKGKRTYQYRWTWAVIVKEDEEGNLCTDDYSRAYFLVFPYLAATSPAQTHNHQIAQWVCRAIAFCSFLLCWPSILLTTKTYAHFNGSFAGKWIQFIRRQRAHKNRCICCVCIVNTPQIPWCIRSISTHFLLFAADLVHGSNDRNRSSFQLFSTNLFPQPISVHTS